RKEQSRVSRPQIQSKRPRNQTLWRVINTTESPGLGKGHSIQKAFQPGNGVLRRAEEGGEELPCCSLRAQGRSGIEVDNEQRDKVELWRSYHPEPPGHTALLVVKKPLIITKTHSSSQQT
ncbi:Aequorin-1, partial [Dissostichus eleginoides]